MDNETKRTYDKHAKRILSNKRILAHILQRVVDELRDKTIDQIVCYMEDDIKISKVAVQPPNIIGNNVENYITGEETVYFDLCFTLTKINGETKIIFDLEAQNKYNPGYPLVTRGIVYGARMISRQMNTEFTTQNYGGLKKVYSIWVCFNSPKHVGNAISKYVIQQESILGVSPAKKEDYDKMTVVLICLSDRICENEDRLIRLLNVLFKEKSAEKVGNVLRKEYNIPMAEDLKKEVVTMCNLSDMIEEKAIEKGEENATIRLVKAALTESSPEEVARILHLPLEEVLRIGQLAV